MDEKQISKALNELIDDQESLFNQGIDIRAVDSIPNTTNIPIDGNKWLKIEDIICVYVDMIGSTRLSAKDKYVKSTASAYEFFTGTIVKIFNYFEAPYIDVQGDGVFALFDSKQLYRSLVAGVTVKTFVEEKFTPIFQKRSKLDVGSHIGIDIKDVLVKQIGLRQRNKRTDRKNEVWAGKTVNMAAKLASRTNARELLVSDRFYNRLKCEYAVKSCGCKNGEYTGEKKDLWEEIPLSTDNRFDFNKAYLLSAIWCENHGAEYAKYLIDADES